MADEEDFSFPAIPDSSPCSIDSPPLWCPPSPPASPLRRISSSSCGSDRTVPKEGAAWGEDQEGMDMLWEDFNEELCRSQKQKSSDTLRSPLSSLFLSGSKEIMVGEKKATKGSRWVGGGAVVPARRPSSSSARSVLVLVKVLKKLFSIQNHQTHGSVRPQQRPWSPSFK